MTSELKDPRLAVLPSWVRRGEPATAGNLAFAAGAALGHFQLYMRQRGDVLPIGLMRDRLVMGAALASLAIEGRASTEAELRDAVLLTPAGDPVGPAGEALVLWRKAARIDLMRRSWWRDLATLDPGLPASFRDVLPDMAGLALTPVERAAELARRIMEASARAETLAMICAEASLCQALGNRFMLPLMAAQLRRRDLTGDGETCSWGMHRAVISGVGEAIALAEDLCRKSARLRGVAPKLRSKRAPEAIAAILSHDAIAPVPSLSPVISGSGVTMSDRAARRFCERLVELGALRELTGRSSFRLYGL